MTEINLKVNGMHCEGCEKRIKNALSEINGVSEVVASYVEGTVKIKMNKDIDIQEIKENIDDLGFEIEEN